MKIHELKTEQPYFNLIWSGIKKFELRKNDRDFQIGDVLRLWEYDRINKTYSGSCVEVIIVYILHEYYEAINKPYCIISFNYLWSKENQTPPSVTS